MSGMLQYINPAVHKLWVGWGTIDEVFKNVQLNFICFKNIMKTVCYNFKGKHLRKNIDKEFFENTMFY